MKDTINLPFYDDRQRVALALETLSTLVHDAAQNVRKGEDIPAVASLCLVSTTLSTITFPADWGALADCLERFQARPLVQAKVQ